MRAHCINLDKRPERWRNAAPALRAAGFEAERFSAISVSDAEARALVPRVLDADAYARIGRVRETHEELGSLGAVGCYLSHAALWQRLVDSGESRAFIFEDDIIHVDSDAMHWIERAPPDYDLLMLHYHARTPPTRVNDDTVKLGRFFGVVGYVISSAAAKKLLGQCFPITEQIDSFISKGNLNLNIYGPNRPRLRFADYGTDIQTPLQMPLSYRVSDAAAALTHQDKAMLTLFLVLYISAFGLLGYSLARKQTN